VNDLTAGSALVKKENLFRGRISLEAGRAKMKNGHLFFSKSLSVVVLALICAAPLKGQGSPNPVAWQDSKLSVQFNSTSISQILNGIAKVSNFKVTIEPSVAGYVESVSFQSLPLRNAILKILEGSSIDFIIVGDSKSPDGVREVMLLGYSAKANLPPAPPTANTAGYPSNPYPQPNPYATSGPASIFSGRAVTDQPVPAAGQGGERSLPFPDAAGNAAGGTTAPEAQTEGQMKGRLDRRNVPPRPVDRQ
jgi:hypothetical protein